MGYKLDIRISGLCALVPDQPFEQGPPGRVLLLLPNVVRARTVTGNRALDSHYPMLEFDLVDLDPTSPRKADISRQESGRGACLLLGESVSFALQTPGLQATAFTLPSVMPANGQLKANGADGESLAWLSRLARAAPGCRVDQGLVDGAFDASIDSRIIARIKLPKGRLRVSDRSPEVCRFDPTVQGDQEYRQQIATELALEIENVEGPIAVLTTNTRTGASRTVMLRPARRREVLEIRLRNSELDDFLGIPDELAPTEVADFEVYYKLIVPPANLRQRSPVREIADGGTLRTPSLCPPTVLE